MSIVCDGCTQARVRVSQQIWVGLAVVDKITRGTGLRTLCLLTVSESCMRFVDLVELA